MKLKTLVIAPQPFFSPRGTPFSVYYRTMIASELGVEQDFLTYGQGEDVLINNVRFFRTPALRFLGPVKIGPSALKLVHDMFIFLRMIGLLARNRYDCVHAHEEAVFMALFLKPIFRFKLIYDMHSSLPQQLANFEYSRFKPLIALFTWLENKSLAVSDAIITICPDLYNYVEKTLPGNKKNFLIENSIFDPVRLAAPASSGQEQSNEKLPVPIPAAFKKRVVYAGTLESYQGIDVLVQAMGVISKKEPHIGCIIVGGTAEQVDRYRTLARKCGADNNIIFTGRIPQNQARAYIEQADVLVSPRSSGTNTPLKIYEQLASGIPLVATDIYSHTQVLTPEVAFLVQLDPEDMAGGIMDALAPDGRATAIAANARKLYEREYSRTAYVEKLRRVLEQVA